MVTQKNSNNSSNNKLSWNSNRARLQASVNNPLGNTLLIPKNLSSGSSKSSSVQALQLDIGSALAIDELETLATNFLQR